jgi:hypothetical protein
MIFKKYYHIMLVLSNVSALKEVYLHIFDHSFYIFEHII